MLRGEIESKWLSALQSAGEKNTLKKKLLYSGPGLIIFYFSQLEYVVNESVSICLPVVLPVCPLCYTCSCSWVVERDTLQCFAIASKMFLKSKIYLLHRCFVSVVRASKCSLWALSFSRQLCYV